MCYYNNVSSYQKIHYLSCKCISDMHFVFKRVAALGRLATLFCYSFIISHSSIYL
nr:MAG TPA: hypothetical protein [Caudoviricetes sp.]